LNGETQVANEKCKIPHCRWKINIFKFYFCWNKVIFSVRIVISAILYHFCTQHLSIVLRIIEGENLLLTLLFKTAHNNLMIFKSGAGKGSEKI